MRRVLFVPNEQEVEKATPLAKATKLPIQIGDSKLTENIDFNRREIQILEIPMVKEISCHKIVHSQVTFYCDITNEWTNFLNKKVSLTIKNDSNSYEFLPRLKEVNHVRFCPRADAAGIYKLCVFVDDEIYFEQDLEVM